MGIQYQDLNERVRKFMLEELDIDISNGKLYLSNRLSDTGHELYEKLLRAAIQHHSDDWLAQELEVQGCMNHREMRTSRRGRSFSARIPDASVTLAEGEFNRFYARGLCAMAIEDGIETVEVYRGKQVAHPRTVSIRLIGKHFPAKALLDDLRTSQGVEPALGLPPGPNSGLTIRLFQSGSVTK